MNKINKEQFFESYTNIKVIKELFSLKVNEGFEFKKEELVSKNPHAYLHARANSKGMKIKTKSSNKGKNLMVLRIA